MRLQWLDSRVVPALLLGAARVGPDYQKPDLAVPAALQGKRRTGRPAQPGDAIKRGAWWEIFGDPRLNDLETQVDVSNQSLKQAEAQYRQAAAMVSGARANFFPTLAVSASARTRRAATATRQRRLRRHRHRRRHDERQQRLVASDQHLFAAVHRDLGAGPVGPRAAHGRRRCRQCAGQCGDARIDAPEPAGATGARPTSSCASSTSRSACSTTPSPPTSKSLQLTQNQYNVGVVARADVVQADTQLKRAQVQAIDLGIARAQFEHAIALLIGKTPAEVLARRASAQRSRRRQFRSSCRRHCSSAVPMSPSPNARPPPRMRRSASPKPRFSRT